VDRAAAAASAVEVLRASTFLLRLACRPAADLARELEPRREASFARFAFKRMDLGTESARFAAFLTALLFCFAFLAITLRNCKWIAFKSQGGEGFVVAALYERRQSALILWAARYRACASRTAATGYRNFEF